MAMVGVLVLTMLVSGAAMAQEQTIILVAAAASLENVFTEQLIPMFEAANPGIHVEGTYDSSGKLQTQIEEGLEADLFMSAATKQMKALTEQALVDEASVAPLLVNRIVLIAPVDSATTIDSFERIVEADIIALGDPESVPVGQYSQEALTSLGIWDQALAKASPRLRWRCTGRRCWRSASRTPGRSGRRPRSARWRWQ